MAKPTRPRRLTFSSPRFFVWLWNAILLMVVGDRLDRFPSNPRKRK
jgi:hypothetical protein